MNDDTLPYVYLDDEDEDGKKTPKKQKIGKETKSAKETKTASKPVKKAKPVETKAKKKPASKKKKSSSAGVAVLAVLLVLVIIAGGLFYADFSGVIEVPGIHYLVNNVKKQNAGNADDPIYDDISGLFGDVESDEVNDGLVSSDGNSVNVTDLCVTQGLDENWLNILLLGADCRVITEPCRTDTMMICSINKTTGEIKLTSIMRDTAVTINGKTVRINSAYFYGGAKLAVRTINENFGMNIEYCVYVDFAGFSKIAEKLGGIDIDITENEMKLINKSVKEQYFILISQGKMEAQAAADEYYDTELKEYGKNIHLNGMQTLGYARIRKIDSDYARAERQRKVLNTLLLKMKGADTTKIMTLVFGSTDCFKTNMDLNTIVTLGSLVLNSEGFSGASELRLPVNGTYVEEKRGNDAMLYDMNKEANIKELYSFIYGK